jgi:hypothetical protein
MQQNHPVHRKETEGTHQNVDNDCVPIGNLFSSLLSLKNCLWYMQNVKQV